MEEQEKQFTQYLVPANVSARFEFIEGFGWYEFRIVVTAALVGIVVFFVLGLLTKTVYVDTNGFPTVGMITSTKGLIAEQQPLIPTLIRAFAVIIPGVGAFFLVKRDPSSGMSLMSLVKGVRAFKQRQKLYLYKYGSGTEGR